MNNVDSGLVTASCGTIGQYDEMPQLESGYLDSNTTLVALTVSGNDAGFSNTITACANPVTGCPADATVKQNIDGTVNNLETVLEDIAFAAPHAKIILLGYPELFDRNLNTCTGALSAGADVQLDNWADYLESDQVKAVAAANAQIKARGSGTPITFNWSNTEFAGAQSCDNPPGINDYVAGPAADNPADFSCPANPICPSMESYHPTAIGTQRYALALQNALATAHY
jgi:hypothetical protein